MTTEKKKQILIEYQQKELNSRFEKNMESSVDILNRLMVFSMPNSPRKKLVYMSSHQSYKVDIEQLLSAIDAENLLLVKPNWSCTLEYYTINPITREEKQKFCNDAIRQGVSMTIYDYCYIEQNKILSILIEDKSVYEYREIDPVKKGVYEILAYGAVTPIDTIIDIISKNKPALEPEISNAISSLLPKRLITKDPNDKKKIKLTTKGKQVVSDAKIKSIEEEAHFKNTLRHICEKYNINAPIDEVITHLKDLALSTHSCLLQHNEPTSIETKKFEAYLKTICNSDIISCMDDMKLLCLYNSFVSRISVGEIFVNMAGSEEIETYTKSFTKHLYLDTPVIGYWLCYLAYKKEKESDWKNFKYQATRDLMEMIDKYQHEVHIHIRYPYLKEVAGEMQKALRLQLLDNAKFSIPFQTANTFYQYYQYIREEKGYSSVSDFLKDIIRFDTRVDNINFVSRTAVVLQRILEGVCNNRIVDSTIFKNKISEEIKMGLPTKYLLERNETPLENDINQVLRIHYLSREGLKDCHYFIVSWDEIFKDIRKGLQQVYDPNFIMYVSSPTQLASQFSMAHFRLSSEILSDAMFITADTKDAIQRLYDNALSILVDSAEDPSLSSIRKLIDAQLEYMQTNPITEDNIERDGYPIENVIDSICSKVIEWGLSMTYLRKYINDKTQFEIIKSDLNAGYTEIYSKKNYLNGKAIEAFKDHLLEWAKNHQEVDTLEEDDEVGMSDE